MAAEFLSSLLRGIGRGNSGYSKEPESAGQSWNQLVASKAAEPAFPVNNFSK